MVKKREILEDEDEAADGDDKNGEDVKKEQGDDDDDGGEGGAATKNESDDDDNKKPKKKSSKKRVAVSAPDDDEDADADDVLAAIAEPPLSPKATKQVQLISTTEPKTELEIALKDELARKQSHIDRITGEIQKLKQFISKRKQTYKRKRKEEGAPRKSLSAYNLFVRERFARLAKENEEALKSTDTDKQLQRVPPASLVAATGNEWRALSAEEKQKYEEMARPDRERYEEQMANYQPPEKQNRKRNKTGYNIFFSAHVLRLKQSEAGVPSERGSVARLVGDAWKKMSAEEKDYYEREADKQNEMNPMEKEKDLRGGDDDGRDRGGGGGPPPDMRDAYGPSGGYGPPPPNMGGMGGPPPPPYDPKGGYGYGPPPPPGGGYYHQPPPPQMHDPYGQPPPPGAYPPPGGQPGGQYGRGGGQYPPYGPPPPDGQGQPGYM